MWRPVAERLDAQTIAVDLPSEPRPLTAVADELHDTLDQIGVHDPFLVGHSMSAVIAVIYAGEFPVRGMVDVDQRLNPRPFAELLQRMEPALRTGDFRVAFRPIQNSLGFEQLDDATRAALLASQHIDRDLVLGYWDELLRRSPEDLEAEARRWVAAIDAPFLGHFPHLADPDGFAARLKAFVSGS